MSGKIRKEVALWIIEKIFYSVRLPFYMKGYDAVGVQEIVDTAGITKPTLYYYFEVKGPAGKCIKGLLRCSE